MSGAVYLAGPITGLTYEGCTDWRDWVKAALEADDIEGISPMRAKQYLAGIGEISGHGRDYFNLGVISQPHSVVTRDRYDTLRVDVVLMNLLGAKAVSIGSMVELAWADIARTPVVVVMEERGNPHDHMFVNDLAGYKVNTLEEGLHVVRAILL